MVVTYDIYTPYIGDAREMAIRRAHAEGWQRVSVMNVVHIGVNSYEVTLVITR